MTSMLRNLMKKTTSRLASEEVEYSDLPVTDKPVDQVGKDLAVLEEEKMETLSVITEVQSHLDPSEQEEKMQVEQPVSTIVKRAERRKRPEIKESKGKEVSLNPVTMDTYERLQEIMDLSVQSGPAQINNKYFTEAMMYEDGSGQKLTIAEALRRRALGEKVKSAPLSINNDIVKNFLPSYPNQYEPKKQRQPHSEFNEQILDHIEMFNAKVPQSPDFDSVKYRIVSYLQPSIVDKDSTLNIDGEDYPITLHEANFSRKVTPSYYPSYFTLPYNKSVLMNAQIQSVLEPTSVSYTDLYRGLKNTVVENSAHSGNLHMQLYRDAKIRNQRINKIKQINTLLLSRSKEEIAGYTSDTNPEDPFQVRVLAHDFYADKLIHDLDEPRGNSMLIPLIDQDDFESAYMEEVTITSVNGSSDAGPLYNGLKRDETLLEDLKLLKEFWDDLGTMDVSKQSFANKWGWAFLSKMKPKLEVYPYDPMKGEDQKVRNYFAPNSFIQIPFQIFNKVAFHKVKCYPENDSLMGFNLMKGGFDKLVKSIMEAEQFNRDLMWFYSDNLYLYLGDEDIFLSTDGSTFEELRSPAKIHQTVNALFSYHVRGSYEPFKSYEEAADYGVSKAWYIYMTQLSHHIMAPNVLLGTVQFQMPYMASGVNGTAYFNNLGMQRVYRVLNKHIKSGKRLSQLINVQLLKEKLMKKATGIEEPFHELCNTEIRDEITMTGAVLKVELGTLNFVSKLLNPNSTVPMDMLGFDCRTYHDGHSWFYIPVLNADRMKKSLLFPKSKHSDFGYQAENIAQIAPLINVFKYRSLYLLGGWSDPATATILMNLVAQNMSGYAQAGDKAVEMVVVKEYLSEFLERMLDENTVDGLTEGLLEYIRNSPLVSPMSEIIRVTQGSESHNQFLINIKKKWEKGSLEIKKIPYMISVSEMPAIVDMDDPFIMEIVNSFKPLSSYVQFSDLPGFSELILRSDVDIPHIPGGTKHEINQKIRDALVKRNLITDQQLIEEAQIETKISTTKHDYKPTGELKRSRKEKRINYELIGFDNAPETSKVLQFLDNNAPKGLVLPISMGKVLSHATKMADDIFRNIAHVYHTTKIKYVLDFFIAWERFAREKYPGYSFINDPFFWNLQLLLRGKEMDKFADSFSSLRHKKPENAFFLEYDVRNVTRTPIPIGVLGEDHKSVLESLKRAFMSRTLIIPKKLRLSNEWLMAKIAPYAKKTSVLIRGKKPHTIDIYQPGWGIKNLFISGLSQVSGVDAAYYIVFYDRIVDRITQLGGWSKYSFTAKHSAVTDVFEKEEQRPLDQNYINLNRLVSLLDPLAPIPLEEGDTKMIYHGKAVSWKFVSRVVQLGMSTSSALDVLDMKDPASHIVAIMAGLFPDTDLSKPIELKDIEMLGSILDKINRGEGTPLDEEQLTHFRHKLAFHLMMYQYVPIGFIYSIVNAMDYDTLSEMVEDVKKGTQLKDLLRTFARKVSELLATEN